MISQVRGNKKANWMQQIGFLLQNLLFAQHVSGTIMPIMRSSRVLYRWLLPVVLGALVYRLLVWCGAVGYASGLRDAAASIYIIALLIPPLALGGSGWSVLRSDFFISRE
jgi:hypothetical protein